MAKSFKINRFKYKISVLVFLMLFFLIEPTVSQENEKVLKHRFELGTGLNLTCIKPPGNCNYYVPFFLVNYLSPPVFDDFSLKGGVEFTYLNVYSENVNANRYIYLKPGLLFQIPIGRDNKFGAGLQGSVILNKKILEPDPNNNRDESGDLESTLDYVLGFDIKMRKNLSIGLKVSVSLTDPDYKTKCFQLSVNYAVF